MKEDDDPFISDDVIQDAIEEFGMEVGSSGDWAGEIKDDDQEGEMELDRDDGDEIEDEDTAL
ncbi:hypothetical protein JVU11DRAFT_10181 [Chiua virens]|nr:hypothetical protein JVU11DRAFT_10181 [Chiua virens]